MDHFTSFFLKRRSNFLAKKKFFLGGGLNTVFALAILNLISNVGLTSFVIRLPKYLKYSTFVLSENIKICQSRIENLDVITKGTLCTVAVLTFSNIFLQFSSAISTWAGLIFLNDGPKFRHHDTQHPVITILGTGANCTLRAVRPKSTEQSSTFVSYLIRVVLLPP